MKHKILVFLKLCINIKLLAPWFINLAEQIILPSWCFLHGVCIFLCFCERTKPFLLNNATMMIFFGSRLNLKYFVCMVDCPHPLKHLITFGILTVSKKCPMKGPCVISYGLIQMIGVVGVSPLVVLDILLARYPKFLLIRFIVSPDSPPKMVLLKPLLISSCVRYITSGHIRAIQP